MAAPNPTRYPMPSTSAVAQTWNVDPMSANSQVPLAASPSG